VGWERGRRKGHGLTEEKRGGVGNYRWMEEGRERGGGRREQEGVSL
jgi:hypothetical protein